MKIIGNEIVIYPEDIIKSEKIEEYTKELEIIYQQLIYIRNNLILMRKIGEFPFKLFTNQLTFWNLIQKSMFDSTIIMFNTILNDSEEKFTLLWLKNKMSNPQKHRLLDAQINTQAWDEFKDRVDKSYFQRIKSSKEQIHKIRNTHIAHLDYDIKMGIRVPTSKEIYGMPIDDLDNVLDIVNDLFKVLCLNTGRQLEFWDYGRLDMPIDVDEIFESIVRRSYWFDESTEHDLFEHDYAKLSDIEKKVIDEWRLKLNK